jgi:hypothetical protein
MVTTAATEWLSKTRRAIRITDLDGSEETALIFLLVACPKAGWTGAREHLLF